MREWAMCSVLVHDHSYSKYRIRALVRQWQAKIIGCCQPCSTSLSSQCEQSCHNIMTCAAVGVSASTNANATELSRSFANKVYLFIHCCAVRVCSGAYLQLTRRGWVSDAFVVAVRSTARSFKWLLSQMQRVECGAIDKVESPRSTQTRNA